MLLTPLLYPTILSKFLSDETQPRSESFLSGRFSFADTYLYVDNHFFCRLITAGPTSKLVNIPMWPLLLSNCSIQRTQGLQFSWFLEPVASICKFWRVRRLFRLATGDVRRKPHNRPSSFHDINNLCCNPLICVCQWAYFGDACFQSILQYDRSKRIRILQLFLSRMNWWNWFVTSFVRRIIDF